MTKEIIKTKQKKKEKDPNQLTFFEHAQDLRKRIIISFVVVLVFFIVLFTFSKPILQFLTEPLKSLGYKLHFYKVHEAFFSTMKASFFAALIASSPIWITMLIGFITPALKKKEKRIFFFLFIISVLFLLSGFFFSYKVLIPISLNYLLSFSKGELESVISIGFYLDYFLMLFFATGIGFQLPLILFFLSKINIIDYKFLSKGRKYAIIIILISSAIITPPDVISQVILSIPLYFLYEIGTIIVFIFEKKNKNKT
jgi:sec-independent protein translocase protein TatC